ncbi:hypothetical protein FACS189430_07190 [Bacteroidia bacterium]|nr:hypothetical protein FACS189430_07190 [Bacteroidia bacterium]
MIYFRYFIVMLCFYSLLSCHNNERRSFKNEVLPERILFTLHKDFEIHDIVEDVQYIKLEDSEMSIFSSIDKLIIKDNKIYILDITGPKALLVFDMNGKFLYRIGRQGNGPGEYAHSLINFDVDNNHNVHLYDYAKRNMMIFDENGKFIQSFKSAFSFNDFCLLPDNKYLLSLDIYERNNQNKKIMLTSDLQKVGLSYFDFNKDYKNDKLNIRSFQYNNGDISYMLPVNDTLFIFNQEGNIYKAYFFDFDGKNMPENLKNDYEKAVQARKYGSFRYIFNTPICIKDYIFTEMIIANQKYVSVFNIVNHQSTFELLSPETYSITNINMPLCTVTDSFIVSYLDPDTFAAVEDKISISSELKEHLANGGFILCLNKIK